MTKSKRMFAEMLVQARGYGDADDMAKTMSLVDIIYEIKKEELKKAEPEKKEEAQPIVEEEPEPEKKEEPEPEKKEEPEPEKKEEPEAVEVKKALPVVEEEPNVIVKIKDFWSRLTHDSDTD